MALTLTVRSGEVQVPPITLDSPRVVIGRGSGCELCLPDPSVSHRHASIRQRGAEYIVLDEGSTNGTFVGPVKLSQGAPRVLKHGEILRIGRIWLSVRLEQVPVSSQSADLTKQIALGLIAGALQADGQPSAPTVQVVAGPSTEETLVLEEFNKPYLIGRQKSSALLLVDDDVSRRHLQLERRGARIWVRDLGSKNGAVLDDKQLAPNTEAAWTPGHALKVGNSVLELTDPLVDTMFEIDAAPDERIADSIEPPSVASTADDAQTQDAPSSTAQPASSDRSEARVAKRPKAKPVTVPKSRRWGSADVLVLLLALTVFGLSLAGIIWLLGQ